MKDYKSIEDLPATLNAEIIANYLGISRVSGYNLLNSEGFPTLRIGKRMVVTKEAFMNWIKTNTGK